MRTSTLTLAVAGVLAIMTSTSPTTATTASDHGRAERAPTTNGLVVNYSFDNDTGTTARDSSVNRIPATYVNTTAAIARARAVVGRGRAIALTGAQRQYLSVQERNVLDVDRFTLAALVRYTGVQNDWSFGRWEVIEKADAYWINVRTDGRVRIGGFFGGCGDGAWRYVDSTVALPVDTWAHVAATYDGARLTVWVDGQRAGSRAVTGRTCSNDNPLTIGAKDYPAKGLLEAFWDGRLDDVRIYRRALSAAEIDGLLPW